MFTVTRVSDNRINLDIQGKIDATQMASGLSKLFTLSEGFQKGVMLYRIEGFKWPAFDAVMAEALRIPQLIGLLSRFGKIALISDKAWIRRFAEIEGALIPRLKIKAFKADKTDAAEAWLADD
ncbi:MAG: STAS/SEC14 domain-containing protein [Yoonia sp.]|nr:STAS/SEC14 domain-containing protein [Yoonia sp.]